MGKKRRAHKVSDRSHPDSVDSTARHTGSTGHGIVALKLCFMVLLVFLIYSNTLKSPFVFDDVDNIQKNPNIRLTSLTWEETKKVGLFEGRSLRRPVPKISFALNYYFHRYYLPGYHIVNILIHVVTGIFLYLLVKATLFMPSLHSRHESYKWIPFLTALIWLVHPIQTQSVTYIVQRMNSMAAMFYVLSLLCYVKARLSEEKGKKRLLFTGCLLSGLLSLGSKEIASTLPFFIFLYEWYFFQDLSWPWLRRHIFFLAGLIIFLCLVVLIFLGDNPFEKIVMSYKDFDFTLSQRVMTEFRVVVLYISLLIFPHPSRLNLEHDFSLSHSLTDPLSTLLSLWLIAGLIGLTIFMAKRERVLSFCILWFLGNLVIESSVIGLDLIFEHRLYLPSMFVILFTVILSHRYVRPKWLKVGMLCAVAMFFSFWTYDRNSIWGDDVNLWQDCVEKSPRKGRIHYNLGNALLRQGKIEEAIGHYFDTLRLEPDNAKAHTNLGNAMMRQGKIEEAIGHYDDALGIKPNNVQAHYNLGNALAKLGRFDGAVSHYREALQSKPDHFMAHNNLALSLASLGKLDEAISHYTEALRIKKDDAKALNNLGIVLVRQRRMEEAVRQFTEALRIMPDFSEARQNLKQTTRQMSESTAASKTIFNP